jgi:hypothetical protein
LDGFALEYLKTTLVQTTHALRQMTVVNQIYELEREIASTFPIIDFGV